MKGIILLSSDSHTKSELKPGFYFSPGYYMRYWENTILKHFSHDTVSRDVRFKPHREMWVGAIMAAAFTEATGKQHFVSLPESEPPDVEIATIQPVERFGKQGQNFEIVRVEIVRCSLDDGEEILKQISHKNRPGYAGMTIVLYVYGGGEIDYLGQVHEEVKRMNYKPAEVVMIGKVEVSNGVALPKNTFAVTLLYPERAQTLVNRDNTKSFFRNPDVLRKGQRAFSTVLDPIGSFELLPPTL